jgi:nitrilase
MYPPDLEMAEELAELPEVLCRGGSVIVSPLGEVLAGPLYGREGILFADLDLSEVVQARYDFDPVGHYSRPDVLQLLVNECPAPPVLAGELSEPNPKPSNGIAAGSTGQLEAS